MPLLFNSSTQSEAFISAPLVCAERKCIEAECNSFLEQQSSLLCFELVYFLIKCISVISNKIRF